MIQTCFIVLAGGRGQPIAHACLREQRQQAVDPPELNSGAIETTVPSLIFRRQGTTDRHPVSR